MSQAHKDEMGRKWIEDPSGRHMFRAIERDRWSDKVKDSVDGPWFDDPDGADLLQGRRRGTVWSGPRVLGIFGALIAGAGILDAQGKGWVWGGGASAAVLTGAVMLLLAVVFGLTART